MTPRLVALAPPVAVILPLPVAVVVLMEEAAWVVTVGAMEGVMPTGYPVGVDGRSG